MSFCFFFSSRRRHTRLTCDWSSDVCSSDLPREILPGIDLTFNSPPVRYDSSRDVIAFTGEALGHLVNCAVSREAMADHFDATNTDKGRRVQAFLKNRAAVENLVRTRDLSWPVEETEAVLRGTLDVEKLRARTSKQG